MSKLDRPIPMQLNETFKKEKLLHYDICMVFPYDENTNSFHEDSVEAVLQPVFDGLGYNEVPGEGVPEHERFKYDVFKSDDGNGEVFVAVRASVARLKHFADKLDHFFLANPVALKRRTELGWPDKVAPLYIDINPTITKYSPFEPMYLKYRSGEEFQDLYEPMSEARRLGLIHEILTTPKVLGGLQLQFGLLTKVTKPNSEGGSCCGGEKPEIDTAAHAKLIDIFPLHNPEVIAELEHNWAGKGHFLPWQQPISDIRHYYGEKIALYYTWLSHFSLFIIFPSIIGLAAEFLVLVYLDLSFPVIPFYALFVVIWAVFLSEFWKRKEKFTAMKHGMLDFERTESYRTDFESECRTHITGSELLYFPPWKRSLLVTQSFFVAFALCGCVIGTTAAIYTGRLYYASQNAFGNSYASIFASFANSAQIQFWGFIYAKFSNQLTDRENHRTDTEYYDSMIAKNFIFSFVNSYASFFYIAYFASSLPLSTYPGEPADDPKLLNRGQCGYPSCMYTLAINLGIVLFTNMVVGNTLELFIPYMKEVTRRQLGGVKIEESKDPSIQLREAMQEQFTSEPYDDTSLLGDYMETVLLFGYITMFASALPGATIIVFVSLWMEVRLDAWKMNNLVRRPWARGAEDIGTWQDIIDLITAAAVITNAALIVFTMNDLLDYTLEFKFWVFIGFQWVVFSFQYLVRCLVPDVPFDVDIFLERQTVFNDKLIDMDEDDNYEEAKEEYQRLSRVREIVGPVKASVLTDEELKKYLPTEQTETEKHRQIQVKRLFNEATEHLKTNIVASETRDSDVRQSISETEIVADANTNYPKNPRTSADMRLTFAIDEMTRYSESAPPAISPSSPRFEANEEPIHEDDEQVEVEEEGQQEDFAEEGEQDDGEEHLE